ncbi:VCBS repeat-containing protein, partial [bacterium]|nr:VCBS repeat-containing protein [bacterium]
MRWCIPFLFLLTFSGMAYGLGIEGTNPLPNTELFLPSDTLWIVFDGPAAGITANDIFIHGRQAAYGIGWLDVQDRVVRVRPFLPFFVGDRVTVTIHSSLLPPYAFSFWVRAPLGLFPAPDGWIFSQDLRYGSVPCAMALADFDNDGALDIAALFRDRVGVARSRLFDGGGVLFHPTMLSWSFPETAGDERRVIRCGDLNSDGRMDIVTLTHATSTLNLYRNESAPQNIQFGVEESFPLPVTHPADFRLADVSGDGKLDLLVIGSYPQTDSLIILLNTTTSQQDIQFGQRRGVWVSNGPSALDVADLDLNHSLDIVVSCIAAQSIDILFGDTLDPLQYDRVTVLGGTALPAGPDGFVIGNIFRQFVDDRGELLDLAVWSSGSHAGNLGSGRRALDENPYLYLFENSGNRTFVTAPNPFPNWPNDAQVLSVTCADLDRSSALPGGDRDWVIAGILQADSSLFWYDQDRNPVSPVPFELPRPFLTEAGDLDLDGDLDLVVIDLREGDERIVYFMNPDSPPGPSDTLDFGLVPIDGRTDTSGFYYVNQDLYPRTLVNVNTQSLHPVYDFLGVFAPGGQTPETLPRRIEIGETIELRFRFRPQDWVWYPSSVRLEFLGDLGGSLSRTIVISGEGGRSWLGMMELPPVTTHSTLWLGYVEPDSTLDTLFWYRNHGNYPLDVRIRSLTPPFVADTDSETIIPRNRGRFRSLVFHAPSSTTGWFTDTLIARDSLFQWADSTTFPRNLAIADSDTIVVTACVLVNQLPDMACPPTVNEGETGTFHLDVADPNDQSGDSLWCMYLGHTTGTSLSIDTLPDLQPVLRDSFHLPYTVSDSVPPGGEICTLRFELRDRQFPERFVLKECPVVINAIDDSPVIHASEMIEIPELADLRNRPLAYVTDEERDRLDGRTHPLSGYLYPPVAGRYDTIS